MVLKDELTRNTMSCCEIEKFLLFTKAADVKTGEIEGEERKRERTDFVFCFALPRLSEK